MSLTCTLAIASHRGTHFAPGSSLVEPSQIVVKVGREAGAEAAELEDTQSEELLANICLAQ